MNNDNHDDEDHDDSSQEETPVYIVDDATEELLMTALNCMVTLADAQIDPMSGDALIAIADEIAERFAIDRFEVVETVHTDDNGDEEIIYRPKGGSVMPDLDDDNDDNDDINPNPTRQS
jgi:hypothetical protein